jgi:predicted O-methyltransferase YrrM
MEHFYKDIYGWFSYDYLYKDAVERAEDGALFVEIGSFLGQSAAFMCVEIINSQKNIKFDCIDPMKIVENYAESARLHPELWSQYSAEQFHKRLESVKGYYNLIQEESSIAVNLYKDNSIDFLMIDGDHSYDAVKNDIINFLPKMKIGGVITGDDAYVPEILKAAKDAIEGTELTLSVVEGIHFWIEIV